MFLLKICWGGVLSVLSAIMWSDGDKKEVFEPSVKKEKTGDDKYFHLLVCIFSRLNERAG